jgi:hypothetical protein
LRGFISLATQALDTENMITKDQVTSYETSVRSLEDVVVKVRKDLDTQVQQERLSLRGI